VRVRNFHTVWETFFYCYETEVLPCWPTIIIKNHRIIAIDIFNF